MRVTGIELENFRGIAKGAVHRLADVNVLVGANNSGKSTIVEALLRVAKRTSGEESPLGDEQARASLARNESAFDGSALFRNTQRGLVRVIVDDGAPAMFSFQRAAEVAETLVLGGVSISDTVKQTFLRRAASIRPVDSLDASIAPRLWPPLVRDRSDKKLVAALQKIFGADLEQAQLFPDGRVRLLYPEHSVHLDAHGDGMRVAFRMLLVLARLESTIFCVEEPECFQHPRALDRLATAMCTRAKAQSVQLLFTTHSLGCIRAFHGAAVEAGLEFAVHHLDVDADGVLDVRRIDGATFETLDASGTDVRRLDEYA